MAKTQRPDVSGVGPKLERSRLQEFDPSSEIAKPKQATRSWRDVLPIHPAAELFPRMSEDELRALGEDIKKNGLRIAVAVWKEQKHSAPELLDGRNRLDAMEAVGLPISVENVGTEYDPQIRLWQDAQSIEVTEVRGDKPGGDPVAFVVSANIHRRHLTTEQKRELIAKVLKAQPEKSNRIIAEQTKVDHKTVGAVRERLEAGGEIPHHDLREDARGTLQPTRKARHTVDYYSVQAWKALAELDRKRIIAEANGSSQFNAQSNDSIEWARWSWNPVTGCLHDCKYCYARDIAERFYEQGFEPTFLPDRLIAPRNTKVPKQAATEIGFRNVFVCSMADLFGKWVPEDWIDAVFDQVRTHPQWNFLFLTKFPQRLAEREWPANAWCGTTVDTQARVKIAERAFRDVKAGVRWLSVEPMMERLTFTSLEMFNWIVIGGATRSTQTPAFDPPMEWVLHLLQQAHVAGIESVYAKANLRALRGYPGVGISTLSSAP